MCLEHIVSLGLVVDRRLLFVVVGSQPIENMVVGLVMVVVLGMIVGLVMVVVRNRVA